MPELAPEEVIARLRQPKRVFTEQYLNDPIEFDTDARFLPSTSLTQLNEIANIPRDGTEFAVVNVSVTTAQNYAVRMYSPVYNRSDFTRTIKKKFTQLINSDAESA